MKYKEIEKIAIENGWTTKSDATLYYIEREYEDSTNCIIVGKFNRNVIFFNNNMCTPGDFIVIKAAIKLAETPFDERQEEKRYIIPLPHLTTSNGEQLFLTHQGNFFPHVRNTGLRQTWKEKDLIHIPEEYRGFAVEIEVEE